MDSVSSSFGPSLLPTSVAVLTAVIVTVGTWFLLKNPQNSSIPRVPSYLPYVGSTLEYFKCLSAFCMKYRQQFGNAFYAHILGRDWLFLHDNRDFEKVIKSSERFVSFYEAVNILAGKFLPRDRKSDYATTELHAAVAGGITKAPLTPYIIAALKPHRLKAWIPPMVDTIQNQNFASLSAEGEIDLFRFCFNLISGMTARVLLGDVAADKQVADKWIHLVRTAEPEAAFGGPMASLQASLEVIVKGERQAFARAREFVFPYVDAEIQRCVNGEPVSDNYSFLEHTVRSLYKEFKENEQYLLAARKRVANYLFNFSFAAVTNSYGMAAWVIYHIIKNIDGVGDRVRKELKEMSGEYSNSFPELENLILEIGRLYMPGSTMRLAVQPFVLPSTGDVIPADTILVTNLSLMHRDPDIFTNPCEFRPTRFSNDPENKKARTSLFVFGRGMHPCAGKRFAILEVAIFVREAMKTFELQLLGDDGRERDPRTFEYISNIPSHPKLDIAQNNAIWRPMEPVMVRYKRRANAS